jgi:hypothetical protein
MWLNLLIQMRGAIIAYAKDKMASIIELSGPATDVLDKNEDADTPMVFSVFLGFSSLISKPCQVSPSHTASALAPKLTKSAKDISSKFTEPSKEQ